MLVRSTVEVATTIYGHVQIWNVVVILKSLHKYSNMGIGYVT